MEETPLQVFRLGLQGQQMVPRNHTLALQHHHLGKIRIVVYNLALLTTAHITLYTLYC